MPFMRSWNRQTVPTPVGPSESWRLLIVLAHALALLLAVTLPHPPVGATGGEAGATGDGSDRTDGSALPGDVSVRAASTVDLRLFCPRPSGRWWDDYTVAGCVMRMSERIAGAPLDEWELLELRLELGALPAFSTVDVEAIAASLELYERRVAEAREAAVRQATPVARRRSSGGSAPLRADYQRMLDCGLDPMNPPMTLTREEVSCLGLDSPTSGSSDGVTWGPSPDWGSGPDNSDRLAEEAALLEAGIARNWEEAEAARLRIVAGASSASFPFYGWADGQVDYRPLTEHVGSACSGGWMSSGGGYWLAEHEPITITVTCT